MMRLAVDSWQWAVDSRQWAVDVSPRLKLEYLR